MAAVRDGDVFTAAEQTGLRPEDIDYIITAGNTSIMGAMIESNLFAGNQPFPQPREQLRYGVSIPDPCIDWPTTEASIREVHAALAPRFCRQPGSTGARS